MNENTNIHTGHRQRLREKIVHDDFERVSDHEFLESLLYFIIPRKDTNVLAHTLLNEFGSLNNIFLASKEQLMQTKGISDNIAQFLITLPKITKRCAHSESPLDYLLTTNDFIELFKEYFIGAKEEYVFVAFTRENGSLIACKMLQKGSTHKINLNMREILDMAIKFNAHNVALAHNHPNSTCNPSLDDIISTARVQRMLKYLDINLIEHIIFGNNGCTSFIQTVLKINNDIYAKIMNEEKNLILTNEQNNIIQYEDFEKKIFELLQIG